MRCTLDNARDSVLIISCSFHPHSWVFTSLRTIELRTQRQNVCRDLYNLFSKTAFVKIYNKHLDLDQITSSNSVTLHALNMTAGLPSLLKYETPVQIVQKVNSLKTTWHFYSQQHTTIAVPRTTSKMHKKLHHKKESLRKGTHWMQCSLQSTPTLIHSSPLYWNHRRYQDGNELWIQYVSPTPATRHDVVQLKKQLDQHLQQRKVKFTTILWCIW